MFTAGAPIGNPLLGHEKAVQCVAVRGDGSIKVSGSSDNTIRRWDAHTGAPIGNPLRGHEDGVSCSAVSGDGSIIVSGSNDGTIRR